MHKVVKKLYFLSKLKKMSGIVGFSVLNIVSKEMGKYIIRKPSKRVDELKICMITREAIP